MYKVQIIETSVGSNTFQEYITRFYEKNPNIKVLDLSYFSHGNKMVCAITYKEL